MERKDFSVLSRLLSDVHAKAFGESLTKLPHGKAQTLSWLIYDATGELLSYKSLTNYVCAVLENTPHKINPTAMTLSILAQFASGAKNAAAGCLPWFTYRSKVFQQLAAMSAAC
jgi:hypothetical protein